MKEIALIGSNGPVFAAVLSALLQEGRVVNAFTTNPERVMLDTTNVTVSHLDTSSKLATMQQLQGYDVAVVAYETDFTNVANNDFVLHTYSNTVNAAIEAGVRCLLVVGNKDSEAFLSGELRRHASEIDARFISTEGCYAGKVADALK